MSLNNNPQTLLAPAKKVGKWGFIAPDGTPASDFIWDYAESFLNGLAIVANGGKDDFGYYYGGNWGAIDSNLKISVPLEFFWLYYPAENRIAYSLQNSRQQGFLDFQGNEVTPAKYERVNFFSEGLAAVKEAAGYRYIDESGESVFANHFEYAGAFLDGVAPVRANNFYGLLSRSGQMVTRLEFPQMGHNSEGKILAKDRFGKYGYLNPEGKWVIPGKYSDAGNFSEGLAAVYHQGKWGFIDAAGNQVIDFLFEHNTEFRGGLARMTNEGKWGMINTSSEWKIEAEYEFLFSVSEGLIAAGKDGKCGFLNAEGEIAIPFEFEDVKSFTQTHT